MVKQHMTNEIVVIVHIAFLLPFMHTITYPSMTFAITNTLKYDWPLIFNQFISHYLIIFMF